MPAELLDKALEIVLELFEAIKLPVQEEKVETLRPRHESQVPVDIFRVLGLQLTLVENKPGKPAYLDVAVPEAKIAALEYMIEVAQKQLKEGDLKLKDMQRVTGSIVAATFFQRHHFSMARIQPLFIAADERRFGHVIKQAPFRKLLKKALLDTLDAIKKREPVRFLSNGELKKLALLYTDAALELDKNGTPIGWIGGLFVLCDGNGRPTGNLRFAFSYRIPNPCMDIGGLEALAILVAWRGFPKAMLKFFRVACAVDNSSVLYGLAKSYTASIVVTAMVGLILEEVGPETTFFYIPSELNLADILTREKRSDEISQSAFIETVKTRTEDISSILSEALKKASVIRQMFWRNDDSKCKKKRRKQ